MKAVLWYLGWALLIIVLATVTKVAQAGCTVCEKGNPAQCRPCK